MPRTKVGEVINTKRKVMINREQNVQFERQIFNQVLECIHSEHCMNDLHAIGYEYFIDEYTRMVKSRLTIERFERLAETKEVTFELERPTFLDWLLRRRKKETVTVELREILDLTGIELNEKTTPYIEVIKTKK